MKRFLLILTWLLLAHGVACAGVPAEAQDAIDKGVIAARQKDYLLALNYFQDARRAAPESPDILFNIALAEAKIPGRELRAMAWFGAYLAAKPEAENADAVREQIKELQVRNKGNTLRLVGLYQEAGRMSKEPSYAYHLGNRWEEAGDVDSLKQVIDNAAICASEAACPPDHLRALEKDNLERGVNSLLLKKADFDGARRRAASVGGTELKRELEVNIAQALAISQAKRGDFAAAYQTIDGMDPGYSNPHFADKKNAEVAVGEISERMLGGADRGPALSEWLSFFSTDGQDLNAPFYLDFPGTLKKLDYEVPGALSLKLRESSAALATKTQRIESMLERQAEAGSSHGDAIDSLRRYIEANPEGAAARDTRYKAAKAEIEDERGRMPLAPPTALGYDY